MASSSTIRPDTTFITPTGPEHPYAMYAQNIVPEEDDNVTPIPLSIPLGFPGMGQVYQQGARSVGNDIADIVGADGHIEELPPYTRYPDAGARKEFLSHVEVPASGRNRNQLDVPLSPQSTMERFSDNNIALNVAASRTAGSDSDGSFKERWREKSKKRVLCGLPLWCLLVLVAIMLLVGAVGGVIGGVLSNNNEHASASTSAQPEQATWVL